ncbi:hypothetical protein A0J51_03195 [Gluconobacter japonicus]|nr:hypothetical protein A0J51_03195 [Gluconobacter japonicus]
MDRAQQRLRRIEPGRGQPSGTEEIRQCQITAPGLQAHGGETVEHHLRKMVEIVDQERKEADIERLLHQTLDDVLIRSPRPEQPGQCDIEHGECSGQRNDVSFQQTEAAVDRGREGIEESVDNTDIVGGHGRQFPPLPNMDTVPGT